MRTCLLCGFVHLSTKIPYLAISILAHMELGHLGNLQLNLAKESGSIGVNV